LRLGPDGIARAEAVERQLNETCLATFSSGAGREVLAYLRSITVNMVCGPEISAEALRHREGMRSLVGIIETRMQEAQRERTQSDPRPAAQPRARSRRAP
jgi:hypothetical protein